MKYGYLAAKDLAEFFRERSLVEESHSKLLSKLARQAAGSCSTGTFGPLWGVLRSTSEKLSSLHAQMVAQLQDLVREVQRYCEEQHRRHKQVKEEEAPTLEVVQGLQQTTGALAKAREAYAARCLELEKLKRESSPKDLDKAEAKARKACEEYRQLVERHGVVRADFERRMAGSCQRFQELEVGHLQHMKEFLAGYARVLDSSHALVGQVHAEFRQQCDALDIDTLLRQFAAARQTGSEKPEAITFEEPDPSLQLTPTNAATTGSPPFFTTSTPAPSASGSENGPVLPADFCPASAAAAAPSSAATNGPQAPAAKKEGFLRTKWERQKEKRKRKKEMSSKDASTTSGEAARAALGRAGGSGTLHEPSPPCERSALRRLSVEQPRATSDLDSLFHVPVSTAATATTSVAPVPTRDSAGMGSGTEADMLGLFPLDTSASTPTTRLQSPLGQGEPASQPSASSSVPSWDRYAALSDLFNDKAPAESTSSEASKGATTSRGGTPTSAFTGPALPRPPSRRSEAVRGRASPLPMSRTESVGSLSSDFKTTPMPLGSSRGPSPLTIGLCDSIPLAVAFQEVVHARFRGTDETLCQVKLLGDMKVSFPAGIVHVLTNNPSPAALTFRVNTARFDNVLPNKNLVTLDASQSTSDRCVYEFNMSVLTGLLRRQHEQTPSASYFNIDILKYHVRAGPGARSAPLHLVAFWKTQEDNTDLKIDYEYNAKALSLPAGTGPTGVGPASANPAPSAPGLPPLTGLCLGVPMDGGVTSVQAKPPCVWNGETQRALWRLNDPLGGTAGGQRGGSLLARFALTRGPSTPRPLEARFVCEGATLSGASFELIGQGYRVSLVKRQILSGKYLCEP
ncbi:hypothetical protein HPB52_018523 [Rhipicephalus sanguineus]|uniref:Proline serine threonine phosphatase interacting protein pstpip n=1 Tax=Rhipicephalus sanguineus TaxID=34632 RepID=A0A9D4SNQ9_RHISA|nr:hypothetical protein HPB52_018523 [Rhipicephalus sanguineus]